MSSKSSKSTRPEIDTHEFERSHGRPPRGFGSWAFELRGPSLDPDREPFWVHQSLYAAARRRALARARELGALVVVVLP